MAHKGFDEQMAALDALKGLELDAEQRQLVKKMLATAATCWWQRPRGWPGMVAWGS